MQTALTFIIPVRHPSNAVNWNGVKVRLGQTIRSIAAQQHGAWNAVIVANRGADLPHLPRGFEVKWVEFPPNEFYKRGTVEMAQYIDAVRMDKGQRILAGMLHAGKMGHVMLVDDDDLVSDRLVGFVAENGDKSGWYVSDGFGWKDGGKLLYLCPDFHEQCGTSHIIRADLYELPNTFAGASTRYIQELLGSHRMIGDYLRGKGCALEPLPFPGAIYRIGHADNHSRSGGIAAKFFFRRALLRRPALLIEYASRLRVLNRSLRGEFFGSPSDL